jgi:hypothetical protein
VVGQEVLPDWKAAREAVFRFADSETVILGHGMAVDFRALRIHHPLIVDTTVLTNLLSLKSGPVGLYTPWNLDSLCTGLLGRNIRNTRIQWGAKKKIFHDVKEDTLATREIILTCMLRPSHFESWAQKARAERWEWVQTTIQRAHKHRDWKQFVLLSILQDHLLEELCNQDGWTRPESGMVSIHDARTGYGGPRFEEDFGYGQVFPSTDAWEDPMVYDRVL